MTFSLDLRYSICLAEVARRKMCALVQRVISKSISCDLLLYYQKNLRLHIPFVGIVSFLGTTIYLYHCYVIYMD
jgi:hypothetical protein